MDVRITVETTFDNGEKRTHQLDGISRPYQATCPDGIGLRLEDGKRIVEQIQRVILYDQVNDINQESSACAALLIGRLGQYVAEVFGYVAFRRAAAQSQRLPPDVGGARARKVPHGMVDGRATGRSRKVAPADIKMDR